MRKPNFVLTRVFEDEKPEIVPVMSLPWETKANRRGFLGAGLFASATLLIANGCATSIKREEEKGWERKEKEWERKEEGEIGIAVWDEKEGVWRYNQVYDQEAKTWRTITLPCGSPIPPGATCTCNCVPAAANRVTNEPSYNQTVEPKYTPTPSYGTRTTCTCNQVCTCVPVYYSN